MKPYIPKTKNNIVIELDASFVKHVRENSEKTPEEIEEAYQNALKKIINDISN